LSYLPTVGSATFPRGIRRYLPSYSPKWERPALYGP
jgi:hypothetical protein